MTDKMIKKRGKPPGSLKLNARRVAIKIRWTEAEAETVRAAAELAGEDFSAFVRAAALARTGERGPLGSSEAFGCAILDPCCGSKMMWFDRNHPAVVYGDKRSETVTVADRSHGRVDGTRTLHIEPDVLMDFRALPYSDGAFKLVAFDPPHLERAGHKSWMAAKYGKLSDNWRDDLRAGFSECFRVLEPEGVLVFKWNETHVSLKEVLALTPARPLFGQVSGRKGFTHWLVFMKAAA